MAKNNALGAWAFLVGVILAIVLGALKLTTAGAVSTVIVILGLVVGLLNIADKEVKDFLLAGAVLVIVSSLGKTTLSAVSIVSSITDALVMLFVPALIVVSVKAIFSSAKG